MNVRRANAHLCAALVGTCDGVGHATLGGHDGRHRDGALRGLVWGRFRTDKPQDRTAHVPSDAVDEVQLVAVSRGMGEKGARLKAREELTVSRILGRIKDE